ncbi:MAG: hypothetical protein IJJ23_05080 [Clostridia bacterium]|nr:hypothetical protein [Clostridia bacterium]
MAAKKSKSPGGKLVRRLKRLTKRIKRLRRDEIVTIALLVFIFPMGIYRMWTGEMWSKRTRWTVTAIAIALVFLIFAPFTDPPVRQTGGITVVNGASQDDVLGPEAPDNRTAVDIYVPQRTAMIIEATPTPEPTMVWCNIGGQYYHAQNCKWVKSTTPSVPLAQAVRAGYNQCPDCDAPAPVID